MLCITYRVGYRIADSGRLIALLILCLLIFVVATVLDFHNLHQMSLVLSEAGLASDAAFTVKEHFSTTPGLGSLPEVCTHTIYRS